MKDAAIGLGIVIYLLVGIGMYAGGSLRPSNKAPVAVSAFIAITWPAWGAFALGFAIDRVLSTSATADAPHPF